MALAPALLVGVALGGLFDGIILHQILQWHHLVSTQVPVVDLASLERNTFLDGLFHEAMWVLGVVGIGAVYVQGANGRLPGRRAFVGGALIGWGAFNLVDEVLFHVALNLHHIKPGPDVVFWDLAFTALGAAMIALGVVLTRRSPSDRGPAR